MAGIDKSTARAIAVVALLFVVAWALRGYLPGTEAVADRQRPTTSPLALVVDVVLLSISVAIIGFAIITRLRNRETRRPAPGQLPASPGTTMARPSWRFTLIALAIAIGWVLLVMLLMRMGVQSPGDQSSSTPPSVADPSSAPPTTTPGPRQPDSPDNPGKGLIRMDTVP